MQYVIALLLLLVSFPAQAHRPYLVKSAELAAPDGSIIIAERLYGDGIFTVDPSRFQLRNSKGAMLAYTRTASAVATFCFSANFCWAFPHTSFALIAQGWRLDVNKVDWTAEPDKMDLSADEVGDVTAYLEGRRNITRANAFGYPESSKGDGLNFIPDWTGAILSPLAILMCHFWRLSLAAVLAFLIGFYSNPPVTQARLWFRVLKTLGRVPLYVLLGLVTLSSLLYAGTPLFYLWFAIGGGHWAAKRLGQMRAG